MQLKVRRFNGIRGRIVGKRRGHDTLIGFYELLGNGGKLRLAGLLQCAGQFFQLSGVEMPRDTLQGVGNRPRYLRERARIKRIQGSALGVLRCDAQTKTM